MVDRTPLYPHVPRPLDDTDRAIVRELLRDGRMPNAELARRVGVAESTCSARVRQLRETRVVRGVHAEVDYGALGRPVEAMVAVRFVGHARAAVDGFRERVTQVPGVIAAYNVTGADDFLVHVCAATPHDLRDVVLDRITSLPGVLHAETSLVYERTGGTRPLD